MRDWPISMPANAITVVGLGPGRRDALTVEALETLRAATRLYVRTATEPIIAEIAGDLRPDTSLQAFDSILATAASHEEACARIVEALLAATADGPLVYAVPGPPLAGDRTVALLLDGAAAHGVAVGIVDGLSLLEPALSALRLGMAAELQLVEARAVAAPAPDATQEGLQALWTGPSSRLFNAQAPLLIGPIAPGERMLPRLARRLLERYPAAHEVTLIHGAGTPQQSIQRLPLSGLAAVEDAGPATLYVPPLQPLDDARAPQTLGYITARLRAPGGCPWDREQTHASLTPYMIEEAYEAVDAIERGDDVELVEELGDVLLQVVLHSQLAEEEGRFSLADVAEEVNRKLVRRHPHVFGDLAVSGSSEVLRNWEKIKRVEKAQRRVSALDGIPPALPALLLAQTMGRKAAKLGFDWPDVAGVLDKVREELDELRDAATDEQRREELGDLLFALTSVCRHLDLDAEDALRAATRKFSARFRRVEASAQERGLDLAALDAAGLDALWEESKAHGELP